MSSSKTLDTEFIMFSTETCMRYIALLFKFPWSLIKGISVFSSGLFLRYDAKETFVNDTSFDFNGPFILVDFIALGIEVKN